ncbi:MAG: transcriptional repressor [Acidobacteriota bacterium]
MGNSEIKVKELRAKLDLRGAHLTRQRAAVFDYLGQVDHHPTAEQVFLAVKHEIPRISLATVYKNLEALVDCRAATKLTFGDAAARYDIRTDHHHHTRCLSCGLISDLEPAHDPQLDRVIAAPQGFEVKDYRIELTGYCSACQHDPQGRRESGIDKSENIYKE